MDISQNIALLKQRLFRPGYLVQRVTLPHPAVQIYIWVCLTLAAQSLNGYLLALMAGVLILLAFRVCAVRFIFILRKTRWILFSVFLIYAYTGAGDALWSRLDMFSPATDGIVDGLMQLLRLVSVLAGLSILLALLSQSQLIEGLYALSRPLSFLGLSRERVAVRLALTLRYAESAMQNTASNWRDSIERLLTPVPVTPDIIELHVTSYTGRDLLLVATSTAALLGMWLSGGVGP